MSSTLSPGPAELLESAAALDKAERPAEALAEAWRAYDLAPDSWDAKSLLVHLLRYNPSLAGPDRRNEIARLLSDPGIDPMFIATAGWRSLLTAGQPLATWHDDPASLAEWLETDDLALRLLEEAPVFVLPAELALTRVRRWLLLSGRWSGYPRSVAALAAQVAHNRGAWLLDDEERARLRAAPEAPIAAAYTLPAPAAAQVESAQPAASFVDPVTSGIADQYRRWPYPSWSRVMAKPATTLPARLTKLDGGRPSGLPVAAELLVAGCGTGREAALAAMAFPDARVTAIDVSESSLAYAAERCAAAGFTNIDFRLMDLHRVAELGKSFHFITSSGVLHHLPDPEAGWAALTAVLEPGGAMRVMLYSKIARLRIGAARAKVAHLANRPIDDDVLRDARALLIQTAPKLVGGSFDFYSLSGIRDLLFNHHEDPFDIPRVGRALDRLQLELLAFELPTPARRARYRRENPQDPQFRDLNAMAEIEKAEPFLFSGMYEIWCRKPTH